MAAPTPVALFWGEDPYLLRLAALDLLEQQGVRPTEVTGEDWRGGETADLATPSLWGEKRALLVSGAESLPEAGTREIKAYVASPAPDALLVLIAISKAKGGPTLAKAVEAAGGVARPVTMKRQDIPRWILQRAALREVRMNPAAAMALVEVLGEDAASLDQAVEQLVAAFGGRPVGPDEVRSQFRGLGEQRVWDLCDQAFAGRLPEALVTLRSLLAGREDGLMMLGVIASRLRDLIRVRELPERVPSAEAAKAVGLRFDWQVRRYRELARRYSPHELHELHDRVVACDQALKAGVPSDVILPMVVAAIAGERDAGLTLPIRVTR
jgi:DNA polymerase III subunit delta